jgi:hypothetical protein
MTTVPAASAHDGFAVDGSAIVQVLRHAAQP